MGCMRVCVCVCSCELCLAEGKNGLMYSGRVCRGLGTVESRMGSIELECVCVCVLVRVNVCV